MSRIWQVHIFSEGNTRTTAVFFIKYLRTLGFDVTNDIFAKNAWYFRNALVRANYNNIKNNIYETTEYLELFLRNLLLNEKNVLSNRTMHISRDFWETGSVREKLDIEEEKVDIEERKLDIETLLQVNAKELSQKTWQHIVNLRTSIGKGKYFGRQIVEDVTGLKSSASSNLIKLLLDKQIIQPIKGYGKGKYVFVV